MFMVWWAPDDILVSSEPMLVRPCWSLYLVNPADIVMSGVPLLIFPGLVSPCWYSLVWWAPVDLLLSGEPLLHFCVWWAPCQYSADIDWSNESLFEFLLLMNALWYYLVCWAPADVLLLVNPLWYFLVCWAPADVPSPVILIFKCQVNPTCIPWTHRPQLIYYILLFGVHADTLFLHLMGHCWVPLVPWILRDIPMTDGPLLTFRRLVSSC